jgi:hypothetical protein
MTQGKGIVIWLPIFPVKEISGEMTGFFRIDVVLSRVVVGPLFD